MFQLNGIPLNSYDSLLRMIHVNGREIYRRKVATEYREARDLANRRRNEENDDKKTSLFSLNA